MKTMLRTGAAALALLSMVGQSWAGGCAKPAEALALKAAAMQQELMVAALYCNDVSPYNHFVVAHQRELQQSDAMLLKFFVRGHGGARAYHSYKTGLANDFSLTGLHGMQAFCATANAHFDAALNSGADVTLVSFISSQSVKGAEAYAVCERSAEVRGHAARLASNRKD